jgi:hypothetical protein
MQAIESSRRTKIPQGGARMRLGEKSLDTRLRVFVSYSRRDIKFAERLVAELEARNLTPKLDTRDLPTLEDWRRELLGLIREADAVVFIVSAHSISSPICAWEVEQVIKLKKRLAPILLERVPDDRIPENISKINYLLFDDEKEFHARVDDLARALQTDILWLKEHTRLGQLAYRWDERGRKSSFLLHGPDLVEAERWLGSRPVGAPGITGLQRQFIAQSRKDARFRRAVGAAVLIGTGLGLFLMADAGVEYPGSDALRRWSTAHELSLFRRSVDGRSLETTETQAEQRVLNEIVARLRDDGFIRGLKKPESTRDYWAHSQATAAIFRVAASIGSLPEALQHSPDLMFTEGSIVVDSKNSSELGWRAQDGQSFTRIEPALWALSAISLKRKSGGSVSDFYFAQISHALHHYYSGGGAWNLGLDQEASAPSSVYESALAEMALLDARAVGVGLEVNGDSIDQLIQKTSTWLLSRFNGQGWGDGEDAQTTSDALTFQVAAVLIRADLEAGIKIDEKLFSNIADRLSKYRTSPLEHMRFTSVYGAPDGSRVNVQTLVALEPNSRALECSALWLLRANKIGSVDAEKRLVRETIDNVFYREGASIVATSLDRPTFHLALWLNAIGFLKELNKASASRAGG